jgi:4-amino-4-deoxy-L-arabinose transferase-like glycosyltransferase
MEAFWRVGRARGDDVRTDLFWLLGLALVMVGAGLGLRDPWPADEPRFALIARDMVRTGQWLVPMVGGDLYQDKPPVFFWLIALCLKVTGSFRIAFLLPSLLASMGTVALVYDLARRLWNRETGLAAGIVLLSTLQFVWQGRQAQIDGLECFWITLGLYGLLRHLLLGPAWGWYAAGWAAAGLGVITKGVGFLPLLVLIPYAVARAPRWQPRPVAGGGWRWATGPLAFLVAVSIWLVPMLLLAAVDPKVAAYRDEILFQQTVDRYASAWHHKEPFWFFIVNVIPGLWLPLTALLPWTVPRWRQALRQADLRILLLLSWVVLVVLFFSMSAGKRGVYVLPAVPALALATAPWLIELTSRAGPRRVFFGLACFVTAVAGLAAVYLGWVAPEERAQLLMEEGIDGVGPLAVIGVLGVVVCLWLRPQRAVLAYAGVLTAALVVVGFWINPAIDRSRSGATFSRLIESRTAGIPELGMVAYKEQYLMQLKRPTWNFGHARWREWEQEADDAAAWLVAGSGRGLLIDEFVRERCFKDVPVIDVDLANRKEWVVVTGGPDPACVARGQLDVALYYAPP